MTETSLQTSTSATPSPGAHALSPSVAAPLAHLNGLRPPAPAWFVQALASEPIRSGYQVQTASIEALSWGTPGKPGILLMHGNSAHADWYSYLAPSLATDHHVVAISFSGMGGSDWRAQYSVAQWAEEALAVAELSGLFSGPTKPVFVGHSFGGFPVMNACSRFGDRLRLAVIADSPIRTREERAQRLDERPRTVFKPHRVYPTAQEAISRFRLLPPQACDNLFILDHIARTSLMSVKTEASGEMGWTWKFDPCLFRGFKMGKPAADLLEARCPVAWLNGARSQLIDDKVRANIKRYSPAGTPIVELADADHHLMIDQPLAFIDALRGLLARF
jgi:pimeloyl-ACP methyl ester carboxylesterase